MAKPSWTSFFVQHYYPVLERAWDALADNGFAERLAGSRFFQLLASVAPPAADSPIHSGTMQAYTIVGEAQSAALTVDAPAAQSDGQVDQTQLVSAAATPTGDAIADSVAQQGGTVHFGGGGNMSLSGATTLFAEAAANYVVLYSDDFQSGLVMNTLNKTLLEGGPGNFPELGQGTNDVLELSGDFSSGFTLPSQPAGLDLIVVSGGSGYNLVATDDRVAPGATLTLDAMPLDTDGHLIFDGSAETDGAFVFLGSGHADTFIGGAGDDRIAGLGGADMLNGGGGSDTFFYEGAGDSSGPDYDTLAGFTAGQDHIDLPGSVAGFAAPIATGALSSASFNGDLGAALGGLGASQAAWFAPDSGDLAGTIFLVVDANHIAGYQPGEDYVFAVAGAPLAELAGHTDIFV